MRTIPERIQWRQCDFKRSLQSCSRRLLRWIPPPSPKRFSPRPPFRHSPSLLQRFHPPPLRRLDPPRSPNIPPPVYSPNRSCRFSPSVPRASATFPFSSPSSECCYRSKFSERATPSSIRTTAISIRSSHHGRLRRGQRAISKYQLQRALKYGVRVPIRQGVSKYQHSNIIFIYDERRRQEITSYSKALDLPLRPVSMSEREQHEQAKQSFHDHSSTYCTSHSVLLVDTSGSMRASDVQGARSRFSAVLVAIAEDFVRQRIESGVATCRDALSIIWMGETPTVFLQNVPTDWITYNLILQVYKEGKIPAKGHCCYLPSVVMAEELLMSHNKNSNSNSNKQVIGTPTNTTSSLGCPLLLGIFSDGRPSDSTFLKTSFTNATESICDRLTQLARAFGPRLSVRTIGMGSANQFDCLRTICTQLRKFGCAAALEVPSLSAAGVGAAVSSIATSLTTCQTMTALSPHEKRRGCGHEDHRNRRMVRPVTRENPKFIPILTELVDTDDFEIYMGPKQVQHMM